VFVTPRVRTSIGTAPYTRDFSLIEDAEVAVRQGNRRVGVVDKTIGRADAAYGPVLLDRRVRIVVKNPGAKRVGVHLLVDWE
jgi:hypothetical protein